MRGPTLFTELSAQETGIVTTNRYADPRMWTDLNREFEIGALGTGVTIGDYDGDGRPDIFVVSKTESCRLFRNLGNWKFEDVTEKAGVGDTRDAAAIWKQGATFVDINNDGKLDIYVCRFNAPNLLYINQGDGTFKEMAHSYGLDVKDASVMAAFCDYDRDGWLDVFIQTNLLDYNQHPSGQKNYLFHNNHNGTFTNVTERAGISGEGQGHSATWWDYDNDGWPDLYVANDFSVADKLYHNNRDGTFTDVLDRVIPHTPFSAMGADIGDVNNDGRIDLFVAEMAATTHEKDQRGMASVRSQATEPPDDSSAAPQIYHNSLYLNTGTGRVLEAAFLAGIAATDWTWSVRFEDLDNDGRLDLFVTNGMHREAANVDLLNRQTRAETTKERLRVLQESPVMQQAHLAYRNRGDLQFEDVSAQWGLDKKGVGFGAAFGDLSGSGNLDLVYANYQGGVTVLRNDSTNGHRVVIDLRGTISNRYGVGATVTIETASGIQVRQLVLARGYMSSSEPMIHFGLGNDEQIKKLNVLWPSGRTQGFTELAVDQHMTITEPADPSPPLTPGDLLNPKSSAVFMEVGKTTGLYVESREAVVDESALQSLMPMRLNRRGPGLAIGDINGDEVDDVIVGGTTRSPVQLLLCSASGSFTRVDPVGLLPAGSVDDGPLLLFDAEGNGKNALLITKGGNSLPAGSKEYQPTLYLNDGHGHFSRAPENTLPPLPVSVGAIAAADFDRDGRLDLFVGGRVLSGQYPMAPRSALLAHRGGKFEDVTDSLAPGLREVGMVTSALWTDVDGDGWLDLLLTVEWGSVRYFHNNQGKAFEDWTGRAGFASGGSGWWTAIGAADFNGDGKPDYVVGNVGLNTQYRASPERPALLYYDDFKGTGEEPQLIEAYYEGDHLFPWRSRKELGAAIPSLLKRYPRNDGYARATLEEMLGADKLKSAQRFAATEFRSGIFLSQPDGTFRFEALPRLAQIAPFQGLAAGDFDGDGRADIYAVQNSYAPIPAVGRFDGGLSIFLSGDGRGHFRSVPAVENGLLVPGDAKALSVLDLDHNGRPGFLVTQNNRSTLAFRNLGADGRHSLGIRLRGARGNPTAIGARITLELNDGLTQTSEVYAGSGYYSQSTAACFFGYTDANPPKLIHVRWPTGMLTEYAVPSEAATLTFTSPP